MGLQGLPLLEFVCLRILVGKEVVALREGGYQRNHLLSLVRGPGKFRAELLTGWGEARVRQAAENHGEGGAGHPGNSHSQPAVGWERIFKTPAWEKQGLYPPALPYLFFRKSHWEKKG